jgi:hypothetical protein
MAVLSTRLSRWSLPMFVCALVNFLAAQGLMLAGMSWPTQPVSAPGTLAAVHLLVIGWLLLLMFGALFQFVPVITSRPLVSQSMALAALIALEIGLLGMVGGFFGIGTGSRALAMALPAGGAAVYLGVLIACWNIGVPLLRSRPLSLPGRMVLTGLAFLLLTVTLGLAFALALAVPALAPYLAPLLGGVGEHALAGLGGWFTLTAMGVSYKLLPMFMLAPEDRGITGDGVHILATVGFALAIGAGLARVWSAAEPLAVAQSSGYAAIALAVGIYLWDVVRIYRTRKRAVIELHNKAAVAAFGLLGLGTAVAIGFVMAGHLGAGAPVIVFLIVFGWLGGLGLTQLYKIVPFLTWLHRYGRSLGRGAVPRVQELVHERRSYPWFALYFLGVLLGATSVLSGHAAGLRPCVVLVTVATFGIVVEYWRAWRAHYVPLRPSEPAAPLLRPNQRG